MKPTPKRAARRTRPVTPPRTKKAARKKKATPAPKPAASTQPGKLSYGGKEYEATPQGLVRWRRNSEAEGHSPTYLTNFSARIVEDLVTDDGASDTSRSFRIEATLDKGKRTETVTVPAKKFSEMAWPTEVLGYAAIVNPNCRDHARTAIQKLSHRSLERRVFTHTGWRVINNQNVYLHAGGAIGARGPVKGIDTQLSRDLLNFDLPKPPARPDLTAAVDASLRMLDIAPDHVTFPAFAAIWRAILGECNFSIFVAGQTQSGKSELAALAQQHFGARMKNGRLPCRWSSTGNAIEDLGFSTKDALLVVDDFKPVGNSAEQQKWHSLADRVLRGQGNMGGRQRLTAEIALRSGKWPRGMYFSTGEHVPHGQSLRARLVIVEFGWGDVKIPTLTACQADAAAGLYAQTTAGFIKWLAPRFQSSERILSEELTTLRNTLRSKDRLERAPDNVYHLYAAFRIWLTFATETHVIGKAAAQRLFDRAAAAFEETIRKQEPEETEADPCKQFFELIASTLTAGRGYFASTEGGPPAREPATWGWSCEGARWNTAGEKLGWIDNADNLYLSDLCYNVVRRYAADAGDQLELNYSTLRKRLHQRGLLMSIDAPRRTLTIRQTAEGARRNVLHVSAASVHPPLYSLNIADQTDPESQLQVSCVNETEIGRQIGRHFEPVLTLADHEKSAQVLGESVDSTRVVGLVGKKETVEPPPRLPADSANLTQQSRGRHSRRVRPSMPTNLPTNADQNGLHGPTVEQWPTSAAAILQVFPGALPSIDRLVAAIIKASEPYCGLLSDETLRGAIETAWQTHREKQTSPGLFLHTVPAVLAEADAQVKRDEETQRRRAAEIEEAEARRCKRCVSGVTFRNPDIGAPAGGWSTIELHAAIAAGDAELCHCEMSQYWREAIEEYSARAPGAKAAG